MLLLVWGFGGLLEGMAGFGTAVAIPAAILIGLGFKPMFSALVSLIGNTVATGFGAVGVPVTTLCNEVAESGSASAAQICETSAFAIIQLAPLFIILPFIILTLTDKHNLIKNLIIALWVGVISVVVQFVCGYYLGSRLQPSSVRWLPLSPSSHTPRYLPERARCRIRKPLHLPKA